MPTAPQGSVAHVAWSRQATIYEVNLRQYTPEGTFNAFAAHLPRLKRMGVAIVWLMPVHPIGQRHRKGTLGSGYAVRDHLGVNPGFGTLADLRALVARAHALGLRVLLDWVANHTAWDHPWLSAHPEWYQTDARGEIVSVTFGEGAAREEWTDVVALDYRQPALRAAMVEAMAWWVREVDVDGFRCDVAGLVPTDFWAAARAALDAIKPVFLLAEWSDPGLHAQAFDMTYDWALHELMVAMAQGRAGKPDLLRHLAERATAFPADAYRMTFTSNHDINAWKGSDAELFGQARCAMAVLAATLPGMPLVYGGQEAGLDRRLAFFEKDPIAWGDRPLEGFFASLLQLKRRHPALANGAAGGPLDLIELPHPTLFAFRRVSHGQGLTVVVNLGGQAAQAQVQGLGEVALPGWGWHWEETPAV